MPAFCAPSPTTANTNDNAVTIDKAPELLYNSQSILSAHVTPEALVDKRFNKINRKFPCFSYGGCPLGVKVFDFGEVGVASRLRFRQN